MDKAVVYWIHLPEHTDPDTEGYIGVTIRFDKRMRAHRNSPKGIMSNVVAKHGWENLVVDTLHSFSPEICYALEEDYRPFHHIGWNVSKGGEQSGVDMVNNNPSKLPHVKELRRLQFIENNPAKSEEARKKNSLAQSKLVVCPHCGKEGGAAGMRRHHFNRCKHNGGPDG